MIGRDCPRIATADVDLNAALIGLPAILSPAQGLERPVALPAGADVTLTFRNPADADAHVLGHYLMLWHLGGGGTLTALDPTPAVLGGVGADVRLSFGTAGGGRYLSDTETHWANFASYPGRPHRWPVPQRIEPRGVLSVRVRNYDTATSYAISLHPLVLRQTAGVLGRELRAAADVGALRTEQRRITAAPTPWPAENVKRAGVPVLLFSPQGGATLPAGSYATPGATVERRITTHASYWLHVDRLLASLREVSEPLNDANLTLPVFAQLRDSRNNLHLTDGWIPVGCLAGTAEYPALLPAEWVTPTAGSLIVSLRSLHATDVVAQLGVGGFYRTEA